MPSAPFCLSWKWDSMDSQFYGYFQSNVSCKCDFEVESCVLDKLCFVTTVFMSPQYSNIGFILKSLTS